MLYYNTHAPLNINILDYSYAHHKSSTTGILYYDVDFEIKSSRLVSDVFVDILFKHGDQISDNNKTRGFPLIGKGQYRYNFVIYNEIIPNDTDNIEMVFFENAKVINTFTIPDFKKIN